MSVTISDIQRALRNHGDAAPLHPLVKKIFKNPPLSELKSSPTALLKLLDERLAEAVDGWIDGKVITPGKHKPGAEICLRPIIPHGRHLSSFIERELAALKPDAVLLDASPLVGLGAGNLYAFSLHNLLGLPRVIKTLSAEDRVLDARSFLPGSALETIILNCYLERIPLIPVGMPLRTAPSRTEQAFGQFLEETHEEFDEIMGNRSAAGDVLEQSRALISSIFKSGSPVCNAEREYLIDECCYLASRIAEIVPFFRKGSRILAFIEIQHLEDLQPLLKLVGKGNRLTEEFYHPPQGVMRTFHYREGDERHDELWQRALQRGPLTTRAQTLFRKELDRWLKTLDSMTLTGAAADDLITHILDATRHHPDIERGASVRGALALREVAQGYAFLGRGFNRTSLYQASLITLPHRIRMKAGSEREPQSVVREISQEVIYGLRSRPQAEGRKPAKQLPLTKERLRQVLEGLTDVALKRAENGQLSFSAQDWSLAQELMNHPLVQEALQHAGYPAEDQEALGQLLEELEKKNLLQHITPDRYNLSDKGKNELMERLKQKLARGEISPEELAEMLNQIQSLPTTPSGMTLDIPKEKMTQFLAELMDAQHQGRSMNTSLEDIYVHYTLGEKKGVKTDPLKLDYQKLQIMIHQLEEQGLVRVSGPGAKQYTLTSGALSRLLAELIPKSSSSTLTSYAFKKQHEIEKAEVRRYKTGDVYRDISIRHTLKEMVKHGKTLQDIGRREFRSFDKKPVAQMDIVLCIDVSASMKEQSKLRYAKLALAGLARAVLEKSDRVGIVSFSNTGTVVTPLTDDYHAIMDAVIKLRADQYTNIGNGLMHARNLLLRDKGGNKKYIVLITDGQPNASVAGAVKGESLAEGAMEGRYVQPAGPADREMRTAPNRGGDLKTRELLGTKHALIEARTTRDKDIHISVLLITHRDDLGEWTARKIAQIGRGKFYRVKTIESMPLNALQMFQ